MFTIRKALAVTLTAISLLGASACCRSSNSSATAKCKQVGSVTCNSCCVANRAKSGSYTSSTLCTCY